MNMLEAGKKAPAFNAVTDGDGKIALKDLKGERGSVFLSEGHDPGLHC